VRALLAATELVIASELTVTECRRALARAEALGKRTGEETGAYETKLAAAAESWARFAVDALVLDRTGRQFPVEPVRTLDAIHLATALLARDAVSDLALLSLDDRIRTNARALGFSLVPGL
jgi:hypothetical protein